MRFGLDGCIPGNDQIKVGNADDCKILQSPFDGTKAVAADNSKSNAIGTQVLNQFFSPFIRLRVCSSNTFKTLRYGQSFGSLPGRRPVFYKFQNRSVRGTADGLLQQGKTKGAGFCQGAVKIKQDGIDAE